MKMPGRPFRRCWFALITPAVLCCSPICRADLLVVDHPVNHDYVRQYNATTGAAINSTLVNLDFATGVTTGPDGLLYVGTSNPGSVFHYNASSGVQVGTGPFVVYNGMPPTPDPRDVINPQGMRFGPDGNLYIADEGGNQNIHVYSPTGTSLTTLTPPTFFSSPTDLTFGPNGNLYAVSGSGVAEYSFTSHTFMMIVQAATGAPTNPIDLGFGTNGQLYVLDFGTGAVFHYDANGSPIGAGNGLFLTLDSAFAPAGMAVGPDGNLYISGTDLNTADGQVLQYNATTGAFDKTFISGLSNPGLLAFTAVPEPASASLLTIGALLLARSKRRS